MNERFDSHEAVGIWKDQPTEGFTLSACEIRERIERSKAKVRRQSHLRLGLAVVWLMTTIAAALLYPHPAVIWIRVAGFVAVVIWLSQLSRFTLPSGPWITTLGLASTSKSESCLDFYRAEVLRQRHYLRVSRVCGPIFSLMGLAMALVAPMSKRPSIVFPLGLALTAFSLIWFAYAIRALPKAQHEIDELDGYEGA